MVTLRAMLAKVGDLAQQSTERNGIMKAFPSVGISVLGCDEFADELQKLGASRRKSVERKPAFLRSTDGAGEYQAMEVYELKVEGVRFTAAKFRPATPEEESAAQLLVS